MPRRPIAANNAPAALLAPVVLPVILLAFLLAASPTWAAPPATAPAAVPSTLPAATKKLPHIEVDVKNKQVRVECESCKPDYGLEFFVCADNSNEYESVLHTAAKPSDIHLGLLMLGLVAGEPVRYDQKLNKYFPPHGPPLKLSCEFESHGKKVIVGANEMLRDSTTHKMAPPLKWVFAGSRVLDDGSYAADGTGSIVAILNSDWSVITMPKLAGTGLEGREWEYNPEVVPPAGTKVWLIIEPAGPLKEAPAAAGAAGNDAAAPQEKSGQKPPATQP